jgi:glycosyltransferase involved in cell wall biosynthesis
MKSLSVVIPCYNEERNIPLLLERFESCTWPDGFELILVDNGSTDGTHTLLQEIIGSKRSPYLTSVHIEENRGYGHGIMTGISSAKGDLLAWTHADLQTNPADLLTAYELYLTETKQGRCVVKGRRRERPLADTLLTGGMSMLASALLGTTLRDINAQPKLFGREFSDLLSNPPEDFSLDLYWLYIAQTNGYRVSEIPVHFGKREFGVSKSAPNWRGRLRTIRRTVRCMVDLRMRMRSLQQ